MSASPAIASFQPLCGVQLDRHGNALCCAACFAPLGDANAQLNWARCSPVERTRAACAPHSSSSASCLPPLQSSEQKPPAVPCTHNCGEIYCDAACLDDAKRHGHRLLCVGALEDETHPLFQFKLNALQSERSPTYSLAAALMARLLCGDVLDGRLLDNAETCAYDIIVSPDMRCLWETDSDEDDTAVQEEAAALHAFFRDGIIAVEPRCLHPDGSIPDLLSLHAFGVACTLLEWPSNVIDTFRATPLRRYIRHHLRQPGVSTEIATQALAALTAALDDIGGGGGDSDDEGLPYDDGDSAASDLDADPDVPVGIAAVLDRIDVLCPPLRVLALFPHVMGDAVLESSALDHTCVVVTDTETGPHAFGAGPLRAYVHTLDGKPLADGEMPVIEGEMEQPADQFVQLDVDKCVALARNATQRCAHDAARALWRAVLNKTQFPQEGRSAATQLLRGDAWHGVACALLNQGDWRGAHYYFTTGAAEVPQHKALSERATNVAAYSSHPHTAALSVVIDASRIHVSKGRFAVLSAVPVLTAAQCAEIVAEAEERSIALGGWHTQRHYSVSTTDMPLAHLPRGCAAFNAAMAKVIAPLLHKHYPHTCDSGKVCVHDAFVVRYDAQGGQSSLPMHRDQGMLSLTLALNGAPEFEGGGTQFVGLPPVCPDAGHVLAFNSGLMHGGCAVTAGRRYIIAAFLWVGR